ncbi:c-type cytochrome biogenesis protein CcsB [Stenoxybacter acetivorans]|uniref:c-type cytochrome biogenesis protein CcsB n=1 Tax=Stenoxybacter acetivorans TaxID=422441 RepID=UPI0005617F95|nr:c-type cytochrome biogenesis protein CcsB [Stenoxybacter acetivorans]
MTKPQSPALPQHELLANHSIWHSLSRWDWLFAVFIAAAGVFVQFIFSEHHMNYYEIIILWCSVIAAVLLGWFFKPLRWYIPVVLALAYLGVSLYGNDFSSGSQKFLLRYFFTSQSAIMWQCALIFLAFFCYLFGTIAAYRKETDKNALLDIGCGLGWAAAVMGLVGLLVRWYESYLLRPDAGHIPVSNLYEVFILFMVITALMYAYYEGKFQMQRLGAFVYFFLSLLVIFVLWYSLARNAQEIQPLIPALQSWWMKIHVPANFIGYGAFCMAAMFGVAELWKIKRPQAKWLPEAAAIEEVMYKAIAVGFLFFTIATILGALWAADAWGRYWSWDPKETWAFIVWLNYAVWLHMRLVAGWRGKILAWWAVIGLFITAFAFVGVNMFLSGLHSYGTL